jgi:glycosyltransferase involved in cell wall biosynthesis
LVLEASQSRADTRATSRLVVPECFVIDDGVRRRLRNQLDRADPEVAGIVAPRGPLWPGESFRVHAEWCALEPMSAVRHAHSQAVPGAALLRPGVDFTVRGDAVEVADGTLLVDPGTHVHDRLSSVGTLAAGSERGRSPFPRRPLVLFLGLDAAPVREGWARRAVNRLTRREVEARLATPTGDAGGMHLTRPCTPSEESVHALDPDVIITLDEDAARAAPGWCRSRSTVIVSYEASATSAVELVPWIIGRALGRLRARVGPSVQPVELDSLVHRLSFGPQPAPPSNGAPTTAPDPLRASVVKERREMTVVIAGDDPGVRARTRGLVDQLLADGVRVEVVAATDLRRARDARVLLVVAADDSDALDTLIAERAIAELVTVLECGTADLDADASADSPTLTERALARARACGAAISAPGAVHRAIRKAGVRSLAVPSVLVRTRAAALYTARAAYDYQTAIIGWHLEPSSGLSTSAATAGEGITRLLGTRPDLVVEVTGDATALPAVLRDDERVMVSEHEPEPIAVASRTLQVWTPPLAGDDVAVDTRPVVEASLSGVPVVTSATASRAVEGHVAPDLVIADASTAVEWERALGLVLDDPEKRMRISRKVARHARNVYGPVAFKATANRLYGWAAFIGETR